MDIIDFLSSVGANQAIPYATGAIAAASVAATVMPPPSGRGAYAVAYWLVQALAMNRGRASNAQDKK